MLRGIKIKIIIIILREWIENKNIWLFIELKFEKDWRDL
jgi:hypothetical protein